MSDYNPEELNLLCTPAFKLKNWVRQVIRQNYSRIPENCKPELLGAVRTGYIENVVKFEAALSLLMEVIDQDCEESLIYPENEELIQVQAVAVGNHALEAVSHVAEEAPRRHEVEHAGSHQQVFHEIPDPAGNGILLNTIYEETYYSVEDVSMGPVLPLTLEELTIDDSEQQVNAQAGLPQVEEGLPQETSDKIISMQ